MHQIGIGALGPVFRTYEPERDRLVAVKAFRLDITPEQAGALSAELTRTAQAGLFHPSIVEPLGAGVQGTLAYRAEEYVAAESLDVAIRHYAPAPLERVLPFITQLASAIDFARSAGVGHGALHLRDIFVTPDEARASGFGVVEAMERMGLRAPVRRPYSAPERISGEQWGTPADVFSLAAITYELLTGRRPAGTGEQIGLLGEDQGGPHARLIHDVLARATAEDPAARYPSAGALTTAIEAAGRGEKVPDPVEKPRVVERARAAKAMPAEPAVPAAVPVIITASEPPAPAATPSIVVPVEPVTPAAAADVKPPVPAPAPTPAAPIVAARSEPTPIVPPPDAAGDDLPLASSDASADVEATIAAAKTHLSEPEPLDDDALPLFGDESRSDRGLMEADEPIDVPAAPVEPAVTSRTERHAAERYGPFAVHEPAAVADDYPSAGIQQYRDSEPDVEPADDLRYASEPAGARALPWALAAVLCLVLGFGAGYFIWGRAPVAEPSATSAAQPPLPSSPETSPAPAAPAPAKGAPSSAAKGKAWSEQTITPPPVPNEAPTGSTGPGRSAASAGAAASTPTTGVGTGRIVVESTPPRAGVTINDKWAGRTPVTIDSARFGRYTVRVVQPGFEVSREQFTLSASDPSRRLALKLTPVPAAKSSARKSTPAAPKAESPVSLSNGARYTGTVYVDSRPRGARVFVDGKAVGTTPLRLPDVASGSHVIRLELHGHYLWSVSRQVSAGQETRVTGSLEPLQ